MFGKPKRIPKMRFEPNFVTSISALFFCVMSSGPLAETKSGFKQTPSGVPWYVADRTYKGSNVNAALQASSLKWREPWVQDIKSTDARGKFRLVSVNDTTFVVIGKLRGPIFLSSDQLEDAQFNLLKLAIKETGCSSNGSAWLKRSAHWKVEKIVAPVQCDFD